MSLLDRLPPSVRYWHGRKVFLSDKQSMFRVGGCNLNRANPILIINLEDPFLQINRIVEAVKFGVLLDITDNNKELIIGGIGHGAAKTENTGKKVYITVDKNGGLAIKAAETPEEIAKCEDAIKQRGIIIPDEYKIADALAFEGRIRPGEEAMILHNLEEKVENANTKVFGPAPTIKPGPHKAS